VRDRRTFLHNSLAQHLPQSEVEHVRHRVVGRQASAAAVVHTGYHCRLGGQALKARGGV
jgi:hypothetical protein